MKKNKQKSKNPDLKSSRYLAFEESPPIWGNPGRKMIFKYLKKNKRPPKGTRNNCVYKVIVIKWSEKK